jgi:hypothetical protein
MKDCLTTEKGIKNLCLETKADITSLRDEIREANGDLTTLLFLFFVILALMIFGLYFK